MNVIKHTYAAVSTSSTIASTFELGLEADGGTVEPGEATAVIVVVVEVVVGDNTGTRAALRLYGEFNCFLASLRAFFCCITSRNWSTLYFVLLFSISKRLVYSYGADEMLELLVLDDGTPGDG